jgi:putative ABC transport system permease protein
MLWSHYLVTAARAMRRRWGITLINLVGLSLGLAGCFLLALFVEDEWTFDRFHERADRLFRVTTHGADPSGAARTEGLTPIPLAPVLAHNAPGVEAVVRFYTRSRPAHHDGRTVRLATAHADTAFFDCFTFPAVAGSPSATLRQPDGLVLTTDAARRLFERPSDAVGRTVQLGKDAEHALRLTVGAVVEAPPANSSLQFDAVTAFDRLAAFTPSRSWAYMKQGWGFSYVDTFVQLRPGADPQALTAALDRIVAERYEAPTAPAPDRLALQPLADVHHDPAVTSSHLVSARSPTQAYVLAALALLVLVVACVNFVTLTLGQSARRLQEVGVRKSMGAGRAQIRGQFWGEAVLMSVSAAGLALGAARLALPSFNRLAQKTLTFDLLARPWQLAAVVALVLATGLAAGSYPALVLARLDPSQILRGRSRMRLGHGVTRGLTVVQFALSIAFIAGTFVVVEQMRYVQTKDLGFDPDPVVALSVDNRAPNAQSGFVTLGGNSRFQRFAQAVRPLTTVRGVSTSVTPLVSGTTDRFGLNAYAKAEDGTTVKARFNTVDTAFVETMGLRLVAGRSFADEATQGAVVVNEAFVRAMGWDDPVGRTITPGKTELGRSIPLPAMHVVGVVEDFHFATLHHAVEPVILSHETVVMAGAMRMLIRLTPGRVDEGLDQLRQAWAEVAPDAPFDYAFLDDRLDAQYRAERRWQRILTYASGFALAIAALGLFGLATLATARRTKEIGIRKALGASVGRLLALLSKDFLLLVAGAFVLGAPVAYVGAQRWLAGFAYRVELSGPAFAAAGVVVLAVAALAVGTQALRAAQADPVEALRQE